MNIQKYKSDIITLHTGVLSDITSAVKKSIQLGEKLSELKGAVVYGEWENWIEKNLPFPVCTAQWYMQCYTRSQQLQEAQYPALLKGAETINQKDKPKEKKELQKETEKEPKSIDDEMPDFSEPAEEVEVKRKTLKDPGGMEIPEHLEIAFSRKHQFNQLINKLSGIRQEVKELCDREDPGARFLVYNNFNQRLQEVIRCLRFSMPYAVCRYCGGTGGINNDCKTCGGCGFVNESLWISTEKELK